MENTIFGCSPRVQPKGRIRNKRGDTCGSTIAQGRTRAARWLCNLLNYLDLYWHCGHASWLAKTATLPKGWKGRLVNLPAGDTEGVQGLCLDPHDLAIAKYVAPPEKDIVFTRELAKRGIVSRDRLLALLDQTPVSEEARGRIHTHIAKDFGVQKELDGTQQRPEAGRINDDTTE
jgi:hypothetical protein